jgi:hypothetical protein
MQVLRVGPLPEAAGAAATRFYAALPQDLTEHLVIVFPPADHSHRAWRLAAVQGLAREHAPLRVNAIAGDSERVISTALAFLAQAPGVTGQYLTLDSAGTGTVIG